MVKEGPYRVVAGQVQGWGNLHREDKAGEGMLGRDSD